MKDKQVPMKQKASSLMGRGSRHRDRQLQPWWNSAQLGLLLLPMSPLLGGVGLLVAMVGTWKQRYREIHRRWVNRGFAILAVWLAIATGFSADPSVALLGLFNFLPFFAFFAAFSLLIQTPAQMRRIAWIAVATSVPVVIIGLGQLFWGWSGPVKLWPILYWQLEATGTPPGRMASVFAYANVLASYFLITFILGLGLWFETARGWRKLTQRPKQTEKVRDPRDPRVVKSIDVNATGQEGKVWEQLIFLSVALLGNGYALLLTNSRNGWAIAAIAVLAFALYHGWRLLVAGFVAVLSMILGSAFAPEPLQTWLRAIVPSYFWMRLSDELFPERHVATLRTTQWQFAWDMTRDRPLTGWGLRTFTDLYEAQTQVWMGHPHNLFLMLAAETGIPATLLLSGLVGWVLAKAVVLLWIWRDNTPENHQDIPGDFHEITDDKLIFFTYLVAFGACILFHLLDVTLFDSRVNILGWLLLAAICGVTYRQPSFKSLGRAFGYE